MSVSRHFAISRNTRIIIRSLILLLFFAIVPGISNAETIISAQTITSDTTWSASGSPYILKGNVTVDQKATLTIKPGVVVKLDENVSISASGGFSAQGTSDAPIVFQWAKEGEYWGNISLNTPGSNLSYCRVIGGGYVRNLRRQRRQGII